MTDKPADPDRPNTGYEPAESPYDQPTEKITPAGRSDRLPRTEDELDFPNSGAGAYPTEKIPTYRASEYEESKYSSPGYRDQPTEFLGTNPDASAPAAVAEPAEPAVRTETVEVPAKRGTTDLGLLLLRVAVGGIFLVHGLQKLVGLWNGPGLDGFRTLLETTGYDQAGLLAVLGAVGETAGGALLILGLATPLAGAAVLATIINAWCFRQAAEPGLQFFAPDGVEYETLLGIAAAAIILTGPGRIALDGRRGWATRPRFGSFLALVVGIAGGACLWVFLNGANPLVQ